MRQNDKALAMASVAEGSRTRSSLDENSVSSLGNAQEIGFAAGAAKAPRRMREILKAILEREVRRLGGAADLAVFALYDPAHLDGEPVTFECFERENDTLDLDVSFSFDGVGIWYIVNRDGETFHVRKILAHLRDGCFITGQIGDFEGFWDEFPEYVAEDRWIQASVSRGGANDDGFARH